MTVRKLLERLVQSGRQAPIIDPYNGTIYLQDGSVHSVALRGRIIRAMILPLIAQQYERQY